MTAGPATITAGMTADALKNVQQLNSAIEEVFLFTLNKFSVIGGEHSHLVFLSGLAEVIGKGRC